MKKLLLALWLVLPFAVQAQNHYTFTQKTETYAPLAGAQKISPEFYLNGQNSFGYLLPFPIKVKDILAEGFVLGNYGEIALLPQGQNWGPVVVVLQSELANYDGNGAVYASITGNTGDRIFKLEYRNLELWLYNEMDPVNYQVWFYEADNSIELRFGCDENIFLSAFGKNAGPVAGIFDVEQGVYTYKKSYYLTGNPASATFNADAPPGKTSDSIPAFSSNIPKNSVYRFQFGSPSNVGIKEQNPLQKRVLVFPNPVSGQPLQVVFDNHAGEETALTLTTLDGKTVHTQTVNSSSAQITTEGLAQGVYLLQLETEGSVTTQKVIVQ